jgi:uncharacterized membrane protein YhaH (DUF805 family)
MNWYLKVLKKYAVFNGRARRAEYWYFALVSIIISIILVVIDGATGSFIEETGFGLLSGIYTLAILIPTIAVGVRRLHDTNRSGWWIFIGLIPIIGFIVLIVFFVIDGDPSANQYGEKSKGVYHITKLT